MWLHGIVCVVGVLLLWCWCGVGVGVVFVWRWCGVGVVLVFVVAWCCVVLFGVVWVLCWWCCGVVTVLCLVLLRSYVGVVLGLPGCRVELCAAGSCLVAFVCLLLLVCC